MDIQNEIRIGTPHDHGNHAMSKFGVIFIGYNWEGKRTLMCLECGTTWTIEKGKAPAAYWVCPLAGCNEVFKTGITSEGEARSALWSIMNLWRPFTDQGTMMDNMETLEAILEGEDIGCEPGEYLKDILDLISNHAKIKPGVFGTELALNTIRHYVAHLWQWFAVKNCLKVIVELGFHLLNIPPEMVREKLMDGDKEKVITLFSIIYGNAHLLDEGHVRIMDEVFYRYQTGKNSAAEALNRSPLEVQPIDHEAILAKATSLRDVTTPPVSAFHALNLQ